MTRVHKECSYCQQGFPLLLGVHRGSQRLGMILDSPCANITRSQRLVWEKAQKPEPRITPAMAGRLKTRITRALRPYTVSGMLEADLAVNAWVKAENKRKS